jgi:hypothetical protein
VPFFIHSTLQDFTDRQKHHHSSPPSNSFSGDKISNPTYARQKRISRKPIPQSLLDDRADSPPRSSALPTSSDELEPEQLLSATGGNYPIFNPYTSTQYSTRTNVSRSQTVLGGREERAKLTESSPPQAVEPSSNVLGKERHHVCGQCEEHQSDLYYCNLCDMTYCGTCWNKVGPHRTGKVGPGGIPHEKTDQVVADKLRTTLEASPSDVEQEELFRNDENTAWFGVVKDESEDSIFYDYGRYADIMTEISRVTGPRQRHGSRFPGLVCFVGETGKYIELCYCQLLIIPRSREEHPCQSID